MIEGFEMDGFIEKRVEWLLNSDVCIEITKKPGTMETHTTMNVGGPADALYVMMNAVADQIVKVHRIMNQDDDRLEEIVDGLLAMVKDAILDTVQQKE